MAANPMPAATAALGNQDDILYGGVTRGRSRSRLGAGCRQRCADGRGKNSDHNTHVDTPFRFRYHFVPATGAQRIAMNTPPYVPILISRRGRDRPGPPLATELLDVAESVAPPCKSAISRVDLPTGFVTGHHLPTGYD